MEGEGTGQAFALHLKMVSLWVWLKGIRATGMGVEDYPVMDTAIVLYIFFFFYKNC